MGGASAAPTAPYLWDFLPPPTPQGRWLAWLFSDGNNAVSLADLRNVSRDGKIGRFCGLGV